MSEMVEEVFGCPNCGNREMDQLVWKTIVDPVNLTKKEFVGCVKCNHSYDPNSDDGLEPGLQEWAAIVDGNKSEALPVSLKRYRAAVTKAQVRLKMLDERLARRKLKEGEIDESNIEAMEELADKIHRLLVRA